ncbi:MAG: 1-acyl-sn-glycerol-3-phosphate acyltransferase [Rubrivivax sp.]|nr:1-acyl-sn-glycerol-3-phosphate acyltransferase [Rubrivivax sp.]
MRLLRAAWRLFRAVLHALHGLLVVLLILPSAKASERHARVRWWSARLLQVMGIQLRVQGSFKPGSKLLVANHISWLDIMAIHAVCPEARFVSKADVQSWPLIGRLVDAGGTLYIQREKRRDALRVVHQMAEALRAGDTVAVFPEGTTAEGHVLLPFHANLLQAAIATELPVQPLALRYSDDESPVSRAAQYVGDTTLAQSLWMLARAQGLVVSLRVLPPQGSAHADRRALAHQLRAEITEALSGLDAA